MSDKPAAMDAATKLLRNIGALQTRTNLTEKAIKAAAQHRLDAVHAEREALGPQSLLDPEADRRYRELNVEIGRLGRVLAESLRNLEEPPAGS